MFDFIRKHTKITMGFLFLLIVPSFVLFGLDGYSRSQEQRVAVAKVDGRDITQPEWDRAHQIEIDKLRASMPTLDIKELDSPAAKYATLERLVRDRVIAAAAEKSMLGISDQRLAKELQQSPEIMALRLPDGSLDKERYRQLLAAQGMSPEMFEANVRADLATRQVMQGIGATGFATPAVADLALNPYFEKRQIQVARLNAADYAAKLSPTDAELEAFYKANEKLFQSAEQVSIEYVVLDTEAVKSGIAVSEADLKTYYEQNTERLNAPQERRASHILITSAATDPAEAREKAKQKAAELLLAVKKSPASFAELARKNSQDPGSAANGGDLEFFTRGAMVKPFEDAVFAMNKGDISDVVESDFGYHIIQLTDIKTPKQRTFEEMRPQLAADMQKQEAQKKFSEAAEIFTNTVYEQSDSLKPAADRLKLELKTAANVLRTPAPGATGALANPKFLAALFSPDAIDNKRNTEALEVGPGQMVSGRVVQHTTARTQDFAEVKPMVRTRLLAQQGAAAARKDGENKLAAWKAAPASAVLGAAQVVSRQDTQQQDPLIIDVAMRLGAASLPAFAGVDLGEQGYAIVQLSKVLPREVPPADVAKQEREQYAQWWTSAENLAYLNLLKERFNVKILVAKPDAASTNQDKSAKP